MSKYFCKWYRNPHTRNEKKQNQEGWCRAKRRPAHLIDSYDDKPHGHQKSWKKFRKTQYHIGGRGKEHTLRISNNNISIWSLEKEFRKLNIPFRIDEVREPYRFKRKKWKLVKSKWKMPVYCRVRIKDTTSKSGWNWAYKIVRWEYQAEWQEDGWEWQNSYRIVAYDVTWWSDKDIGVEYILNREHRY